MINSFTLCNFSAVCFPVPTCLNLDSFDFGSYGNSDSTLSVELRDFLVAFPGCVLLSRILKVAAVCRYLVRWHALPAYCACADLSIPRRKRAYSLSTLLHPPKEEESGAPAIVTTNAQKINNPSKMNESKERKKSSAGGWGVGRTRWPRGPCPEYFESALTACTVSTCDISHSQSTGCRWFPGYVGCGFTNVGENWGKCQIPVGFSSIM